MISVTDARFVVSATAPSQYPQPNRPEVAFVGRSNVGKSSMINALAARKKLVRVSNTPGRTRTLNFFDVDLTRNGHPHEVRLCDLPGYGFAKAPKEERAQWREMISTYLRIRDRLRVVVAIVDAEVGPTGDDVTTLDFLAEARPKILVAATKLDRVPKAKRLPQLRRIAQTLELPDAAVVGFSATEKIGVDEVWNDLLTHLSGR